MEGYLWKRRFYFQVAKEGILRKRYVILDEEKEELRFKTCKEENKTHKVVPFDEIAQVLHYGDHGILVSMRHVATSEASGAAFVFEVEEDGAFPGMSRGETRNAWVQKMENKVNTSHNGLSLVTTNEESVHVRYRISLAATCSILGTGMSGDVRLVHKKLDDKPFAMKTISLSGIHQQKLANLRREIDILKSMDHPHIVKLQETFLEPKLYFRMVLDICNGGELFHRLKNKTHFSEHYSRKLVLTMLKALKYLHVNKVVHRDLKLENWLFRNKENYAPCEKANELGVAPSDCDCKVCEDDDIALIDFGLSRRYRSEDEEMNKQLGTYYYMAPEVLNGKYKGNSCDLWSLGVISYMMLSGKMPFCAEDPKEIIKKIKEQPVPDIKNPIDSRSVWNGVSTNCKEFVLGLLEKNPERRLSIDAALTHPWIVEEIQDHAKQVQGQAHTLCVVNDSILQRLKNFTKYKELKRLIMEVIAFSLDHNEIKELSDLFEDIDVDNNGYVTFDELLNALKSSENVCEEEIKQIFEALDEENNGRIHVNEFVAGALQAKYHLEEEFLAQGFAKMDVERKGKVTIKGLKKLIGKCASEERIQKIWDQFDKDKCDVDSEEKEISFQQFMMFMRTDGEEQVYEYRRRSLCKFSKKDKPKTELQRLKERLANKRSTKKESGKKSHSPGKVSSSSISESARSTMSTASDSKLSHNLSPITRIRRMRVTNMFNFKGKRNKALLKRNETSV